MKPKGSFQRLQQTATGHYPEPDQDILYSPTLFIFDLF
jgi:hypothetical protein